eukprot:4536609-Prorocentrum_lima.AAC.1
MGGHAYSRFPLNSGPCRAVRVVRGAVMAAYPHQTLRCMGVLVADCLPGAQVAILAEGHARAAAAW